jgi:serine protease AprX
MVKNYAFLLLSFFFLLLSSSHLFAQENRRYLIYFTDKEGTPYNLSSPEEFLSPRALQRRQTQQIPIQARDLPVNPAYAAGLNEKGAEVIYSTRWFNGAVIACTDSVLELIMDLPYVVNTERLNRHSESNVDMQRNEDSLSVLSVNDYDYGFASNQIKMLGAELMHEQGFTGEGKVIAVFDAGFTNVEQLAAFSHLLEEGRLLGYYDFVANVEGQHGEHSHGTRVLSCLAADMPGYVRGTAPKASYYLFRTEDAASEYKIEEAYWLIAAERADSLGVDVINSSLGYNQFDDTTQSYTTSQLNGATAIITRAATIAAGTGMLVVNSAGNEGLDADWQGLIVFPADADSIIAVGAVQPDSTYVTFSSHGPTADGRIKPDLAAQGAEVAVVNTDGNIIAVNGTSFASPLLCGMAAATWQAYPHLTNMQLIELLKLSGSQYSNPDNMLGYGIPSFSRASVIAGVKQPYDQMEIILYPTFVQEEPVKLRFKTPLPSAKGTSVMVTDITGRLISYEEMRMLNDREASLGLNTATLPKGMYFVKVLSEGRNSVFRFIKQ